MTSEGHSLWHPWRKRALIGIFTVFSCSLNQFPTNLLNGMYCNTVVRRLTWCESMVAEHCLLSSDTFEEWPPDDCRSAQGIRLFQHNGQQARTHLLRRARRQQSLLRRYTVMHRRMGILPIPSEDKRVTLCSVRGVMRQIADSCDRQDNCENQGYLHPRDCSKCLCPDGFVGVTCSELEEGMRLFIITHALP